VNPILEWTPDLENALPLVELKQFLVFFVEDPPGPELARSVYETYLNHFGDIFKVYRSTSDYAILDDWTPETRRRFEDIELPKLRQYTDWGYGFSDNKPIDSWLFMFHGFRPFQEPDCASFFRFEFDWQVEPKLIRDFTEDLMEQIPLLSGSAGYLLQWQPNSDFTILSLDRTFAYAMRYWGCEVMDFELTSEVMKTGYKCVNWLTIIGDSWRAKFTAEVKHAASVAYDHSDISSAVLLQAAERPLLGDRNRLADLDGYIRIAKALLPLQIKEHEGFGGDRWTDENTMKWIRRFTDSM
jgi:hypothetical protein